MPKLRSNAGLTLQSSETKRPASVCETDETGLPVVIENCVGLYRVPAVPITLQRYCSIEETTLSPLMSHASAPKKPEKTNVPPKLFSERSVTLTCRSLTPNFIECCERLPSEVVVKLLATNLW